MKFPTYEEMGKEIAEKALDEYLYKGKTLREWIEIIIAEKQTNTAEWISDNGITYCSNCKYEVWGSGLTVLPEWKHCPCCGRKIAE